MGICTFIIFWKNIGDEYNAPCSILITRKEQKASLFRRTLTFAIPKMFPKPEPQTQTVLNLFARWMVPPWNVNFKLSQTSPADQTKYNFIMIRLFHFQLFFPGGQVRGQAQKQNRRLKVHSGHVLYIQCD